MLNPTNHKFEEMSTCYVYRCSAIYFRGDHATTFHDYGARNKIAKRIFQVDVIITF